MHTLATIVEPGTLGGADNQVLVGRTVANAGFLRALLEHGTFERYLFFVGEIGAQRSIEAVMGALDPEQQKRAEIRNILELPGALARGDLSVFHQNSPVNQLGELMRLRDRHAQGTVAVTGQIHSLSYPNMMLDYIKTQLLGPSACDAVFCSSTAGRRALERCYEQVARGLESMGMEVKAPAWDLPVVPLGIDVASLEPGSPSEARAHLQIPQDAFVVLSIARFTEYDKMDLFPLLTAFSAFSRRHRDSARPPVLLLAGARQGTRTPEMVAIWAKALNIDDRVVLRVDFPEEEKALLLAAADCFVAASDNPQETFGISVVEAMAAGLPVIASDLDGYKDTVSEEVGIRVPTHWNADMSFVSELGPLLYQRPLHLFLGQGIEVDLAALQEAMEAFYSDPQRLSQMGRAAAERARERYDWPKVMAQYEAHWARLCGEEFEPRSVAQDPFVMDFHGVFGHYTTTLGNTDRLVKRSDLSMRVCEPENSYPIYWELKNVFMGPDVTASLGLASSTITLAALVTEIERTRFPGEHWRASLLGAWLLKHGLLDAIDSGEGK